MSDREQRSIEWTHPAATAAAALQRGLKALDYLQAIVAGEVNAAPAIDLMGARLTAIGPGKATISFKPDVLYCNALGVIHGGIVSALLDTAMGYAATSTLKDGEAFTTAQLNVNFVSSLAPSADTVAAVGNVVHRGKRTLIAEAVLTDSAYRLFARGSATCLIVPVPRIG